MLDTTGDFQRDLAERAYFGGTYNGGVIITAVGAAVLSHLREHPEIYDHVDRLGDELRAGMAAAAEAAEVTAAVVGTGSIFGLHFAPPEVRSVRDLAGANLRARSLLQAYLLAEGVFISPSFGVISAAHTREDVEAVVEAHHAAFERMKADGILS
jgi:glutamate-1-semialdehyde aminotransferase